jgi:hypothetical protein
MTRTGIGILAVTAAVWSAAHAADPWPAEMNSEAVPLTRIDPEFSAPNMSGAAWNPVTRTLWLANNSGRFYAVVEDGKGGFKVAADKAGAKARWVPGGDLESICQADFAEPVVYLMDENGWIREYDVTRYGVVKENRRWDIREKCAKLLESGPEGITFVPDDWLRRARFPGPGGKPYVSTNGMGGVMFVGHQRGGYIHVFDLNRANGGQAYVGRYKTGQDETAGLEFDRSSGMLYIWHNKGGNYLEVSDLGCVPEGGETRLRQVAEFSGPRKGNLEGFAITAGDHTNSWCFVTDDDNKNGEAVMWYRRLKLPAKVRGAGKK